MIEEWRPMHSAPYDRTVRLKFGPMRLRTEGYICWGIRTSGLPFWVLGREPGGERGGSEIEDHSPIGWQPLTDEQIAAYPNRVAV